MSFWAKEARRGQALAEIDSLTRELKDWHTGWSVADRHPDGSPRGQYQTQLNAVYNEVSGTARILREDLVNLDLGRESGEVYGHCARTERQIIWLWRVWYFFRDKFEQRRDPRFGELLRAADEVVWSCYRPFFQLPSLQQMRQPAPLPYVEPDYSPKAVRRDQKQALDRRDREWQLVREAFSELPVPILKIPITAVNNPWALTLVGHETGHIVEPLLAPDFGSTFRQAVRQAVESQGASEADQEAWGGWADEIFADLYSVLTMGQWAVWTMAQFITAGPASMSRREFVYPPPAVRLELMAQLARAHGIAVDALAIGADPTEELARDLALVPAVAASIAALPEIRQLAKSLPFTAASYDLKRTAGRAGEVEQWSQHLLGRGAPPASQLLRSARMVAAATALAWSEAVFSDAPAALKDGVGALRTVAIDKMKAAAAPGVRSAAASPKPAKQPGRALFDVLSRGEDLL